MRSIRLVASVAAAVAASASASAAAAWAAPPVIVVTGGGNGHGVGMSQYGAEGFALHGYTYRHILAHYYPGTSLKRVGNPIVRVGLSTGQSRVVIGSSAQFRVTGARGHSFVLPPGDQSVTAGFSVLLGKRRRQFRFPIRFAPGKAPLTVDGTAYRGKLTVLPGLTVVNTLPVESYLRGVVPAEMPSHWLPQALEVQAVAARSYALSSLQPAAKFDLYRDTRSQLYLGVTAERPSTDAAVAATAGRVLTWHGHVARTYFSSSSGGRTAANEDAWPGSAPIPYLRSVADPYDSISPYHRWPPLVFSAAGLARRLGVGAVADVVVDSAPSGWAQAVRVRTETGERSLPAREFASKLGLRSQDFQVGVLKLDAASGQTVYGRAVRLEAVAHGMETKLQLRRPGGAWVTEPPSPAWQTVRPPRSTEYRLVVPGVAATPPVRVDVLPSLVVEREQRALSGRVAPAIDGLRLDVQRLLAGDWLTVRQARVRPGGSFRLDRSLPVGTYRVKTAATDRLLPGASAPIHVP